MAKCVAINGRIQRISDEAAALLVRRGGAVFVSKKAWKIQRQAEREDFAAQTLLAVIREANGLPGVGHG